MPARSELHTIDCQYIKPRFASAYLRVEGEGAGREAAFIDNNTSHSVPLLLARLKLAGLEPGQVRYVIITHVHLDHAGGTSRLLAHCPNAQVLCHPRAARHVIDPSKLVASARHVYGNAQYEELYGEILPIDAARVREVQDGEKVALGGRELSFFHARGHANHHFCIEDPAMDAVFTGDAFGVCYPGVEGFLVLPSTSPTDFDAALARASVQRIRDIGTSGVYLTHYGRVERVSEGADQLLEQLDFSERLLGDAVRSDCSDETLPEFCEGRIAEFYKVYIGKLGLPLASTWKWIQLDLKLNAAGIAHVARKTRKEKARL